MIILYEIVHVLSDIGLQQKLYCFLPDAKPGPSKNARFAAGKPSQKPEKTQKKSVQKEGSFARPSAGRAFAPKKRKPSSEELSLPIRLIWLAYVLPFHLC